MPIFLIGLLTNLPSIFFGWPDSSQSTATLTKHSWPSFVLGNPTTTLCEAFVVGAVLEALNRKHVRTIESIARALRVALPVLIAGGGASLIYTIGLLLLNFPRLNVVVALYAIPAIIATLALYVVVPICVVERCSPVQSFYRNVKLTTGQRWSIFAATFVIAAASGIISLPLMMLQGPHLMSVNIALSVVLSAITSGLYFVLTTVIYYDLRILKDGILPSQIDATFA